MNIILRSAGTFGMLLFGLLFSFTFLSPNTVVESTKAFVSYQIEKQLREQHQTLSNSNVVGRAAGLADKLGLESKQIQINLANNLPEKIASVIAAMCSYDCERKKALAQSITSHYLERLKNIDLAQDTLSNLIKGKYIEIVGHLKRDLRIFLGSNFSMFLLLLAVSFAKPEAVTHLFLPGLLLCLATIIASAIYLFGQDWFYVILYNDYMGWAYLAYLSLIFAALIDIILNRARVTTELINAIAKAVGSALSVAPC